MYLEISDPMAYHVALYIRLSKEHESEGPSQSATNQKSLLEKFVKQHKLSIYDTYIDDIPPPLMETVRGNHHNGHSSTSRYAQ